MKLVIRVKFSLQEERSGTVSPVPFLSGIDPVMKAF
jgi:hypothetical protein